ncbi:MAG TPA: branched-chain amino acid ABC transporter permease [Chloroflexota bacterium]|nr:branched-chain amino acid ABC transporter permease [Chloroflexota bacterium]
MATAVPVRNPLQVWRENAVARRLFVLVVVIAAFLYPILSTDVVTIYTATLAEVYVLLALGLNIVVGFAGLLDLGYAAFFAIGAYVTAMLASSRLSFGHSNVSTFLFSIGSNGVHINFFLLIPLAAVIAAFFGILFGAPTLRLRGDYLAIVTLGFGEIVPKVIENLGPGNSLGLPNITNGVNNITGIDSPPNVNFWFIHLNFSGLDPRPWYFLGLVIIIISVAIIYRLRNSRLGRSWVAIREDEIAASHAGINITGTRLTAFALGAAFSGFGGLLNASHLGSVSYDQFLFQVSVTILVMVILGGIGSIPGVMVGGAFIAFLNESWLAWVGTKVNDLGTALHPAGGVIGTIGAWLATLPVESAKPMIFGFMLVGVMLLRPQGLIPERRRALEFHPETQHELEEEQEELYTVRTGEI